jgi:hypothetical protein
VKSAKAYGPGEFRFAIPKDIEQTIAPQVSLSRSGHHWIVKKDGQMIKLPADDGLGPVGYAAVELAGERVYTALCGWPACPYNLFATEWRSGEVVWSSRVGATGDWIGYGGSRSHFVATRSAAEKVAVFGITYRTVYAEVFDERTGKNICRFSTAYFDASSPRK